MEVGAELCNVYILTIWKQSGTEKGGLKNARFLRRTTDVTKGYNDRKNELELWSGFLWFYIFKVTMCVKGRNVHKCSNGC